MRIILAHDARPHDGGQGEHLASVLAALSHHELEVYCRDHPLSDRLHTVTDSVLANAVGAVPVLRRRRDWYRLLHESHFDRAVSRRIGRAELFHGVMGQCRDSLRSANAKGARTVLDALNPHVDHFSRFDERECGRFGMWPLTHPLLKRRMHEECKLADLIRVHSAFSRDTFLEHGIGPERVVAIPPPVLDPDGFPQACFTGERFRALFVGLLTPWKGFHVAIEGFRRAALDDGELVVWGGPSSRPVARYLARALRTVPGLVMRAESVRSCGYECAYGVGNVLVHPSFADGWGYVVVEAMACGLPVIVSTWTGASELIEDGVNGYVVEPGDVDAIAERLQRLAADRELTRRLGDAARRTVREALTFELFQQRYEQLVGAACGSAGR